MLLEWPLCIPFACLNEAGWGIGVAAWVGAAITGAELATLGTVLLGGGSLVFCIDLLGRNST